MKTIGITMGDPAGVGPELALKFIHSASQNGVNYKIYGNSTILKKIATRLKTPYREDWVINFEVDNVDHIVPGKIQKNCGQAAYDFLEAAIADAQAGTIDAIVTCPLNKAALEAANISYPGHTEILVEKTKSRSHAMMLSGPELSCSLVTTHIGLADVPNAITKKKIIEVARLSAEIMSARCKRPARLAVLGLNPHSGEGGLFGYREEELIIAPAIQELKKLGLDVIGPLPPDTAFLPHLRKEVDAYICMYHDQGLIPLKTLCFDEGVNITLGLPIIRTSVDHGTAFDIAWEGKATTTSLKAAVEFALSLC